MKHRNSRSTPVRTTAFVVALFLFIGTGVPVGYASDVEGTVIGFDEGQEHTGALSEEDGEEKSGDDESTLHGSQEDIEGSTGRHEDDISGFDYDAQPISPNEVQAAVDAYLLSGEGLPKWAEPVEEDWIPVGYTLVQEIDDDTGVVYYTLSPKLATMASPFGTAVTIPVDSLSDLKAAITRINSDGGNQNYEIIISTDITLDGSLNIGDVNDVIVLFRTTGSSSDVRIFMPGIVDQRHIVIQNSGIALYFDGVILDGDHSVGGGIEITYATGDAFISGAKIENCWLENARGGAIYAENCNDITVENSIFTNNKVNGRGGGIRLWKVGDVLIENCKFYNNSAGCRGGAIDVDYENQTLGTNATVTIRDCYFEENEAPSLNKDYDSGGGAVNVIWGETVTISNSRFQKNYAGYSGAAIYVREATNVLVEGGEYWGNHTDWNGTVTVESSDDVTIKSGHYHDNFAAENGGALNIAFGIQTALIDGLTVENNESGEYGGGIVYEVGGLQGSRIDIRNSTVTGNKTGVQGGGIRVNNYGNDNLGIEAGKIVLDNVTVSRNRSEGRGGGIMLCNTIMEITDCLVSNNSAGENGGGIGMENPSDGTFVDGDTRIVNNHAELDGGGIFTPGYDRDKNVSKDHYKWVTVQSSVVFDGNTAGSFAITIADKDLDVHRDKIHTTSLSRIPGTSERFAYAYNNYDINYDYDRVPITALRVNFVANGGRIVEAGGRGYHVVYVENAGDKISSPTVTKGSDTFLGWYMEDGVTRWNFFTDTVQDHMTLYAHWEGSGGGDPHNPDPEPNPEPGTDPGPGPGTDPGGNPNGGGSEFIPDGEVPLSLVEIPGMTDIFDDGVPLSGLPVTGGYLVRETVHWVSAVSAVMLAVTGVLPRKRRQGQR